MTKQFAELQVYQLGGGIAFGLPGTTTPFLALPSGQATIKPWGTSGFLFENILTGDVIAFVAEYDDVLDSSDAPYGADQPTVFTALAAFFFDVAGGGSGDLASVLANGNESGTSNIEFDAGFGIVLDNNSRLQEGTIDAGNGGLKGIAEICGLGYESKWEGGVRYIMGSSGNIIRQSLYNFANTPTAADDVTKGYQIGSIWTLDDGSVYYCADNTMGAAIWTLQSNAVPNLSQVLASGKSANDSSIIDLKNLEFSTTLGFSVVEAELAWNDTDGTLDLGLKGGLKNKLGQQLVVRARNTSGSLISKGSVVKVVGVAGGYIGINLAQADNDTNSATAFGIVSEDIADNSNGFVTINGIVHGVNTNAFTEGDILYLSPTTPGAITNVKPVSPAHIVIIGYVAKKSASDGHILLHVQNGYELDELHNVTITSAVNNDALIYESSTGLWKNKTIATALGFTPVTNARTITINGNTQDLTANRTFTIADSAGWSYIVKSANQDVTNSATLVDDTELQFSVVAGGQYMTQLDLCYTGNNITSDMKVGFLVSAGTMKGSGILVGFSTASSPANNQSMTVNGTSAAGPVSIGVLQADLDNLVTSTITFNFTASSNGILKFQFANNSAAVGAISRIVKGSILKYKKIN